MPQIRYEVHDVVADGDRVATRATAHGVHNTDHLGVPATGKTYAMPTMHLYRAARAHPASRPGDAPITCPRLAGIFAVELPVRDLAVSRAWYERLFDLRPLLEFPDDDGTSAGMAYQISGLASTGLALREAAEPAKAAAPAT